MGRQKSVEESDPNFHRTKLNAFVSEQQETGKNALGNLDKFILGLKELFSDRPPTTWRFRITSYEDVVFRVYIRATGRQNDFLFITPNGMIIMKRFLIEKYSSLFPEKNTFYGNGDGVTIKWKIFNEELRTTYLNAIKEIISSNESLQVPFQKVDQGNEHGNPSA